MTKPTCDVVNNNKITLNKCLMNKNDQIQLEILYQYDENTLILPEKIIAENIVRIAALDGVRHTTDKAKQNRLEVLGGFGVLASIAGLSVIVNKSLFDGYLYDIFVFFRLWKPTLDGIMILNQCLLVIGSFLVLLAIYLTKKHPKSL